MLPLELDGKNHANGAANVFGLGPLKRKKVLIDFVAIFAALNSKDPNAKVSRKLFLRRPSKPRLSCEKPEPIASEDTNLMRKIRVSEPVEGAFVARADGCMSETDV